MSKNSLMLYLSIFHGIFFTTFLELPYVVLEYFLVFAFNLLKKISPLPSSDLGWEQKQQYSRTCF